MMQTLERISRKLIYPFDIYTIKESWQVIVKESSLLGTLLFFIPMYIVFSLAWWLWLAWVPMRSD